MKKIILFSLVFASCSSFQRIGDLNSISNRNIETQTEYILLKRNLEMVIKNQNNALESAVDEAVKSVPGGEFMKNVSIYVKSNGMSVKVIGDVWGLSSADVQFSIGDKVSFENEKGKRVSGVIKGKTTGGLLLEYENGVGKKVEIEKSSFDVAHLTPQNGMSEVKKMEIGQIVMINTPRSGYVEAKIISLTNNGYLVEYVDKWKDKQVVKKGFNEVFWKE